MSSHIHSAVSTWSVLRNSKSASKSILFLKTLVESYSCSEFSWLPDLFSEIFQAITTFLLPITSVQSERSFIHAIKLLETLRPLSQDQIFVLNFCEFYNVLGTYFRKKTEYARALKYLEKGLELSRAIKVVSILKVYLYLNIAGILSETSKHKKSLNIAVAAAELAERVHSEGVENSEEILCIAYHTIGVQHEFLGNLTLALEWYSKAWDFGKNRLSGRKFSMIEKIELAVKSVQQKFNKNLPLQSKNLIHRSKSSQLPSRKLIKGSDLPHADFSTTHKKPKPPLRLNSRPLTSSSVFTKRRVFSGQKELNNTSFVNHSLLNQSHKEDLNGTKPNSVESSMQMALNTLEHKLFHSTQETVACQTENLDSSHPFTSNFYFRTSR